MKAAVEKRRLNSIFQSRASRRAGSRPSFSPSFGEELGVRDSLQELSLDPLQLQVGNPTQTRVDLVAMVLKVSHNFQNSRRGRRHGDLGGTVAVHFVASSTFSSNLHCKHSTKS